MEKLRALEATFAPAAPAPVTPAVSAGSDASTLESARKKRRYDAAAHVANLQTRATRELEAQNKTTTSILADATSLLKEVVLSFELI